MKKRIWRDGEYVELVVTLSFTKEEARRLIKLLTYSAGAHMGIPPAGYKDNYEGWKEIHGWKLDLSETIRKQIENSEISSPEPYQAGFRSAEEERKKLSEWLQKEYGLEPILGDADPADGD